MTGILGPISQCLQINSVIKTSVNSFFNGLHLTGQVMHGFRVYRLMSHDVDGFRSHNNMIYQHDITELADNFANISKDISEKLGIEPVDCFVRPDATLPLANERWAKTILPKKDIENLQNQNLLEDGQTFPLDLRRDSWMINTELRYMNELGTSRVRELVRGRAECIRQDYQDPEKNPPIPHCERYESLLAQARSLIDYDQQNLLYLIATLAYWNVIPFNYPLLDETRIPSAWSAVMGPERLAELGLERYLTEPLQHIS